MKPSAGISILLLMAGGLFAQRGGFSSAQPRVVGSFGSVVFPGGTPATTPGIQRSFGSVVFPGGGGPQIIIPGSRNTGIGALRPAPPVGRLGGRGNRFAPVFAYPVYVGAYDGSYAYPPDSGPAPQPQNVTVVYPPSPAPVILNPFRTQQEASGTAGEPAFRMYPSPNEPAAEAAPAPEQPYYLLAFKDHTIYSAVAYWVDGDTIHYFTSGNKHNQASLSLVDRELTERLNKETGFLVTLPSAK